MKKRLAIIVSATFAVTVTLGTVASAQSQMSNPASNKAFVAATTSQVTLAGLESGQTTSEVVLYEVAEAFKSSGTGAASVTVSLESALWTYNRTTEVVNDGKRATSSSRASIKVDVYIDDVLATPGQVVFAERLQATGLEANLFCDDTNSTEDACVITGDITLDLFQATKEANAFTFFVAPLSQGMHSLKVVAYGAIDCSKDGAQIACPEQVLDEYIGEAHTAAAIGKSTVLVEEQQNWGSN